MKKVFLLLLHVLLLVTAIFSESRIEFGHIEISGDTEGFDAADFVSVLEENADCVIRRYNPEFGRKVKVEFFLDQNLLQKKTGFHYPWLVGAAKNKEIIYMLSPQSCHSMPYEEFKKVLLHEFVHCVQYSLYPLPVAFSPIPRWMQEGIAAFEAKQYFDRQALHSAAENSSLEKYWLTAKDYASGKVYQTAPSFFEFLYATYTEEKVFTFVKSRDPKKCFGLSREQLQEKWRDFILKNYPE